MISLARRVAPIRALLRHPAFRRGFNETLPVNIGVGAWGLVSGVAMVQMGLPPWLAIFMSLVVYSGGAQLAALPLIAAQAPTWLVLLAAGCVNLRFVVFSVQWRAFMMRFPFRRRLLLGFVAGDASYVFFMARYPGEARVDGQLQYFLGTAACGWVLWQATTFAGIVLADAIPQQWGLAFAAVLALLALLYSLVTDGTSALAAAVAGVAAIAAFGLPFRLHLVVAIVAGVAVALLLERRSPRLGGGAAP
jgi:predicted branched-subunit amino acid permease